MNKSHETEPFEFKEFYKTDSHQRVSGPYKTRFGTIYFRENSNAKNPKFAEVFTNHKNKQISLKSVPETEIEKALTELATFSLYCVSETEFVSTIKNSDAKDGELAIYRLTRQQFRDCINYLNENYD